MFVVGVAQKESEVDDKVARRFNERLRLKRPSNFERRRAVRILWDIMSPSVVKEAEGLVSFSEEEFNELADVGIGLPLAALSKVWMREMYSRAERWKEGGSLGSGIIYAKDDFRSLEARRDGCLPLSGAGLRLDRIYGLSDVKSLINESLIWPRVYSDIYKKYGLRAPTGLLFYGPPGTGKTMLAREIANELNGKFISLKISDVLRGHIGVGEEIVRDVFSEAKANAPAVLFVDEFQALFSAREGMSDGPNDSGNSAGASLTATLTACLDEVYIWNMNAGTSSLITVIAATNEPWSLDSGFLRVGRLDKVIFVGPLDFRSRFQILSDEFSRYNIRDDSGLIEKDEFLLKFAKSMGDLFTGADLSYFSRAVKVSHLDGLADLENVLLILNSSHTGPSIDIHVKYFSDTLSGGFAPSVSLSEMEDYASWGQRRLRLD